jgi:MoaA/NifB/PqqE/SkfB family radical SAM enzyme
MASSIARAASWPLRRLRDGYRWADLPSLLLARLRGISPRAWEEALNARETEAQLPVLRSTPRVLFLEITGRCPIECLICARRYRTWTYGDLSESIFDRLARVFPRVGIVVLGGFGEPLVARRFDDYFDRLSRLGARVALQTSGFRLTEERVERLFRGGLCHLPVSIDSPDPDTYASIRPRISFADVQARVRQMVRLKREAGTSVPPVHIAFVAMRRNIEQLPAMVDLAADLGADNLTVRYLAVHGEDIADESLFYHQELANRMLAKAADRARDVGLRVDLPDPFGSGPRDVPRRCLDPWQVAFVRWNGEVRACCYVPSDIVMGSLAEDSFWRIWNGAAYRDLRRTVNSASPPEYCLVCAAGRQRGVDDERAHVLLISSRTATD